MKKILVALSFIFSAQSFAYAPLEWTDLELYQNYVLTSDLVYENGVTIKADSKFTLIDMMAGGAGFPYLYFQFVDSQCVDPELEAEHGILMMKDSNKRDYKVLIKLEQNCHVGMYVHGSKLFDVSSFR